RGRAGTDDADALTAQAGQIAVRITAGVAVIPAAGVERVALVRLDSPDARQLGSVERTVRHHHETSPHAVAAVGRDDPARGIVVPAHLRHFRLEAGVAVEIVLPPDRPAVRQDLRGASVFLRGHVLELLEERQINVRLDVAHRARVAIPVPGAAEI